MKNVKLADLYCIKSQIGTFLREKYQIGRFQREKSRIGRFLHKKFRVWQI